MKTYSRIFCGTIALISIISCDAFAKPEYKSKLSGFEFGAGIPLVTPLTGYNMFVGYVNKNADTFWGRRFGIRADFTIPSNLRVTATLSDNNNDGYDINIHGRVLGFDLEQSDFSDEKIHMDYITDDKHSNITIGTDAVDTYFEIKNKNMGLLVDFYPFGDTWFLGGIRLSGGYYIGDLDMAAKVHTKNDIDYRYRVGHVGDYLHAQIVRDSRIGVDYHWKYHGPYAGLGFDLGIWRGFKFYMDAGVIFAKAPHVTDDNIDDDNFSITGGYEVKGTTYGAELVSILHGVQKPDVRTVVHDVLGQAVKAVLVADIDSIAPKYTKVIDKLGGVGVVTTVDVHALADDIMDYLDDKSEAPWIDELITKNGGSDLRDSITDIKSEWQANADDANDGIQKVVNKPWDDYEKHKQDVLDDVNDFLDDVGIIPMVKIGFMYRF